MVMTNPILIEFVISETSLGLAGNETSANKNNLTVLGLARAQLVITSIALFTLPSTARFY